MSTISTVDAESASGQGLFGSGCPSSRSRRPKGSETELAPWLPETFGKHLDRDLFRADTARLSLGGKAPSEGFWNLDGNAHELHCGSAARVGIAGLPYTA